MRKTWERVFEYASSPLHGSLSRKLRKGVSLQINEGKVYAEAVLFLGEEFVRVTEDSDGGTINTYYDWESIGSICTTSPKE